MGVIFQSWNRIFQKVISVHMICTLFRVNSINQGFSVERVCCFFQSLTLIFFHQTENLTSFSLLKFDEFICLYSASRFFCKFLQFFCSLDSHNWRVVISGWNGSNGNGCSGLTKFWRRLDFAFFIDF